jgi:surface antigen
MIPTDRFCQSVIVAFGLLAAAASPTLADGLINPFDSSGTSMSQEDSELMKGALKSVLDARKAGTTADWKSASSGLAGRATALDTFEKNGMPCANIEHAFTNGGGSSYKLPFCQGADGTWKIAF